MKFRKIISILLAAMMLAAGILAAAGAEAAEGKTYYEKRVAEYEDMKARSAYVTINLRESWYEFNASKLYGRKITGVAEDGSWILGPWELLSDSLERYNRLTLPWTYFAFAYSFDIFWGTDWPYSGVFWNNPDARPTHVGIYPSGTCRMADIKITVDGTAVVDISNCSPHSEWKP